MGTAKDVQHEQFDDIYRVDHPRRAKPVVDPLQGQRFRPLQERLVEKGLDIDRGEFALVKPIVISFDYGLVAAQDP